MKSKRYGDPLLGEIRYQSMLELLLVCPGLEVIGAAGIQRPTWP